MLVLLVHRVLPVMRELLVYKVQQARKVLPEISGLQGQQVPQDCRELQVILVPQAQLVLLAFKV